MKIKSAEFLISSPNVTKCPNLTIPEYAFIGRSNVGKSSLINMLTQRKKLAQTSSMPGKTILINHFIINDEWALVDLPGYGYAKRGKEQQQALKKMIYNYIEKRQQLISLFILIDSRLSPQKIDLEFIHDMGEKAIPFALVFTKGDKLSQSAAQKNIYSFLSKLKEEWEALPPYFFTSSVRGDGRDELLDYIEQINKSL